MEKINICALIETKASKSRLIKHDYKLLSKIFLALSLQKSLLLVQRFITD